ncbi:hypothetical protein BZA70DRAFT_281098 [Myxozyma melibiosi]|uniref:Uncharacterized protein n=1 Tax=Myxozyma melibiosi TaxID=54550 RepID=A0ABR1F402_9ASCO
MQTIKSIFFPAPSTRPSSPPLDTDDFTDEQPAPVDEPPEPHSALTEDFKRQLCLSPPRNQSSLLSKMLASPVSSDAGSSTGGIDAFSDSACTSRNTTPTPPPHFSLAQPTKGIMRPTPVSHDPRNAAHTTTLQESSELCVLKRTIKFACTGQGKESSREPSASSTLTVDHSDAEKSDHDLHPHIHHPQPQRILRVDDVLLKEREICKLNAEVEAEDEEDDDQDNDDADEKDEDDNEVDDEDEDDDDNEDDDVEEDDDEAAEDENEIEENDNDDDEDMGDATPHVLRLQRTPLVEYESDSSCSTISDGGYASDASGDFSDVDNADQNGEQITFAAYPPPGSFPNPLRAHYQKPRKYVHRERIQRPATPPANMIPDSSDFVCGTFDEDRPIEVAYFSALDERHREAHELCPQDIDPSFPEEMDENDDDDDDDDDDEDAAETAGKTKPNAGATAAYAAVAAAAAAAAASRRAMTTSNTESDAPGERRRCRSPPPASRRSMQVRHHRWETKEAVAGGKAASFQHPRGHAMKAAAARAKNSNTGNNSNSQKKKVRGAIDIVKGLERKNNRRRDSRKHHHHHHRHHDVAPGEGVEKMRQLGLIAVKKGENPYAEWMLSV